MAPTLRTISEVNEFLFSFEKMNLGKTDVQLDKNTLSNAQNIVLTSLAPETRPGFTRVSATSGTTTGILNQFVWTDETSTTKWLRTYGPYLQNYSGGYFSNILSTLTSGLYGTFAYHPITNYTYFSNGVDNVIAYVSGSHYESLSSLKKGQVYEHFEGRLFAGVNNVLWYTDDNTDRFGDSNYGILEGYIRAIRSQYNKLIIWTDNGKIYTLYNFDYSQGAAGPEAVYTLASNIQCLSEKSVKMGPDGLIYFLGRDETHKAGLFVTDGQSVQPVANSEDAGVFFDNCGAAQLSKAAAGFRGNEYWLSVSDASGAHNNIGIIYDTRTKVFISKVTNLWASDFVSFKTSGRWETYFGHSLSGVTLKINGDVAYDETSAGTRLPIESFAVTGAIPLATIGQESRINKVFLMADATDSNVKLDFGIADGVGDAWYNRQVTMQQGGQIWGASSVWGSSASTWGATTRRIQEWVRPPSAIRKARFHKFRFYMNEAEKFKIYGIRTVARQVNPLR